MAQSTPQEAVRQGAFMPADMARHYATPCDRIASLQCLTTLLPIAGIWTGIALLRFDAPTDYLVAAALGVALTLYLVRVFVLMHDCGHDSLFRSRAGNRVMGFIFGVLSGMPQMVWARHHQYHHQTNGNWERYRGPLNVITVEKYQTLDETAQRNYRLSRSIWMAPLGGLHYLILSPRLTWLRATIAWARHAFRSRIEEQPDMAQRSAFGTSYCKSEIDYRHMLWNNLALLGGGAVLALAMNPLRFLGFYLITLSLAGGAAIILFSIQHNFEGSYATGDEGWDRSQAAINGTSMLVLPAWLNWFTADIAYHHVHHLCARIPNYRLAKCHTEQAGRFEGVPRIRLAQIPRHAQCILWDSQAQRIVSPGSLKTADTVQT